MIARWMLAAGFAALLAGCSPLLAGPYDAALGTPPPTPRPDPYPTAGDLRAVAPYAVTPPAPGLVPAPASD